MKKTRAKSKSAAALPAEVLPAAVSSGVRSTVVDARLSRPDPEQTLHLILSRLDDMKAEETVTIDLRGKSSITDYMIVTTGRANRHVGAIAENVAKALKENGAGSPHVEGLPNCDWVLIDTGDVIVHVFRPEVREFYNLEKMWASNQPVRKTS